MRRFDDNKTAKLELLGLFQSFVLKMDRKELNKYSDEHRIIFMITDDTPIKENLMMKGIPLVDFNMIQQLFLENAKFFFDVLDIKDNIEFDPRYHIAEVVKQYYEKLLRLRTVSKIIKKSKISKKRKILKISRMPLLRHLSNLYHNKRI